MKRQIKKTAGARPALRPPARRPANWRRRAFLKPAAGAGMALGLPPFLAACGSGEPSGAPGNGVPVGSHRPRTLFFNLAHEDVAATDHYLHVAGQKIRLAKTHEKPEVLALARRSNAFLRSIPDRHITHHLENVALPADTVLLAYISSNEDPVSGTWSMSMLHFIVPETAHAQAFAHAAAYPGKGLRLSAKRHAYGLAAAATPQDLRDEAMLVDSSDHALALVGLHPDLLSLDPASAAYLHATHIAPDANTQFLASVLPTLGAATVQQSPGLPNGGGWATLLPLTDTRRNPPSPMKMSDGRLNLYYPDWSAQVDSLVGAAIGSIHVQVKNDESLGADVTGVSSAQPLPAQQARGKVWARHDGLASVERKALATQEAMPAWSFTSGNPETGLAVRQPKVALAESGRVEVTIDNVANWFFRWLGVWVQFLDQEGKVLAASGLPVDTLESHPGRHPMGLDKQDTLFVGVLPQATAVMGIPVAPGQSAAVIAIPTQAAAMRLYYAGLGGIPAPGDNPAGLTGVGTGMTIAVNYGLVSLFMAAGAQTLPELLRFVIELVGEGFAEALVDIIGDSVLGGESLPFLPIAMNFLKVLLQGGLIAPVLVKLATYLGVQIGLAEAIDSLPVAGQVARAVAVVTGLAELATTTLDVAISPPVYTFDLVLTHDLSVTIRPDPNAAGFPQPPAGYVLYYKVSYLFDNGTAHVQSAVDVPDPAVATIPIIFTGIPRGGQVNIAIGFYMRNSATPAGQNEWCAAHGATGLFDNTLDRAPDLVVSNVKVPIQAATRYIHTSKSGLDGSGRHVWINDPNGAAAPRYVPPPGGQQPGLGALRSITVRQATSNPPRPGYLGYAWRAYSNGVLDCRANAAGQLDLLANLNTDRGNRGANAQNGYASTPCGLQAGSAVSYSLLSDDANNYYLDSDTLLIRPVRLADAPVFSSPVSGQAVGRLNLDSTRLLLHPAGHAVSVSNSAHKLETLKLPGAPTTDEDAARRFRARPHSGPGTRPGMMLAPAAAAIAPDGAILVLEDSGGNNRIQAFDLGGNPVPFFKQQKSPYFLSLDATRGATYLDLAVEFSGYLYVLSRDGGQHRLDIYHPDQAGTDPVCTTAGINAARLTVDLWRNVYTLNYEVLQLPGGAMPALTEPSVSLWVPPPPLA